MPHPIVAIRDLPRHAGETVRVRGWLYNRRSKGKLLFLLVRDGSGIVQSVVSLGDAGEKVFRELDGLPQESSLILEGEVRADARAPGGHELGFAAAEVVHRAEPYPIALQSHGVDFLLEHRHLWLRSRKPWATLRIRHLVIRAMRDFLDRQGFLCLDAPIFTPNACEGTTTLFEVPYFDLGKAYLTQSGQLYQEAGAMAFGKVYCFGPAFRAERSKTRRHLTEFWMLEPEVAWASMDDAAALAEGLIVHTVQTVLDEAREELAILERDVARLKAIRAPFPRMRYEDCVTKLQEGGFDFSFGADFGAPEEKALGDLDERPVVVHRFPAGIKAFYMKRDPGDDRCALGFDILAPEGYGEIVGGGERSADLAELEKRIEAHGLPRDAFAWYLDLRRYGSVPHAGFGIGLERTVAWICGTKHIRECIPFPRMLYRIYP